MRTRSTFPFSFLAMLCFATTLWAQQNQVSSTAISAAASPVPRLIKFSGTLLDEQARPMKSPVGVTFALYAQQSEGAALWMETQNVETDTKGNYTVLLGANSGTGVPAELFTTVEARWLGVQAEHQLEQPRVLLVSVPYALKAGDAQTLGGLPPSAFAPANSVASNSASSSSATPLALLAPSLAPAPAPLVAISGSGTTNFIPLWTPNGSTLGNSILFQSTTSNVNVNGSLSLPATGTATALSGFNSQPLDLLSSSFNKTLSTAVSQHFRWQAEPLGNNTTTNGGSLNLLYAAGSGIPAETGLKIDNKGVITFASGQTFPDLGDVKSVGLAAPATDFTVSGSPVTSSGTLNFAWKVVPTSANTANAIVKRDASGNFSAGTGTFSGNLSSAALVSGALGSFAGDLVAGGKVGIGTGTSALSQLNVATSAAYGIFSHRTGGGFGGAAVSGESDTTGAIGIYGVNFGGGGVPGFLTFNIGVAGQSNNGIGVEGSVETGVAVRARLGNAAGKLFSGVDQTDTEKFSVDSRGNVGAASFSGLFKSVTNGGLVFPGAGVTNLLQLSFTAPTAGFVFASANGYCNINTGTSNVQWAYVISTNAADGWAFPDPIWNYPTGAIAGQSPIEAEAAIPVSAGANSIFLNVDNLVGTPLSSCGARLTAFFTSSQLP